MCLILQMFMTDNGAAWQFMCWMEIETFQGIPTKERDLCDLRAKQLRKRYFTRKYLLGSDSPAREETQRGQEMLQHLTTVVNT